MMIRHLTKFALLSISALALPFLSSQGSKADPDTDQDRPAYLISQQRFVDAADWVTNSEHPSDLKTLCARAELDLYVGQISQARLAFTQIQARTPESEPISSYGLALCDMASGDVFDAKTLLAQCATLDSSNTHQVEIQEAQAVLAQSSGDFNSAHQLLGSDDSLLAQEMGVIQTISLQQSQTSPVLLRNPPWWLTGGVPEVVEFPGIQAIGAIKSGIHGAVLVGSLQSTTNGDRIIERLEGSQTQSSAPATSVSGDVTVTPVYKEDFSDNNWIVSYTLDGNVDSVANTGDRTWNWNTRSASNGLHVITISLDNSALNQHLTETRFYKVSNKNPEPNANDNQSARPADVSPEDQIVISDTWDLLKLQPCLQPAELLIAKICRQRGLSALALQHDCVAAALNESTAQDQILEISHNFANRIPAWYKLPPGAHVASKYVQGGGRSYLSQGIWRGTTSVREIALTFDDGPSSDKTPPLLDALESVKAPATFMVVGIRAQLVPDIIRRMASDGDEVEDHTYTHPNLDEATPDHIYDEILRDAAIIQACTGIWPHFLRPPGGQSNPNVLQIAQKLGLTGALWTIDVLPAEDSGSPDAVVQLVLKKAVPGAIVLLHNGTYASTQAVPTLVKELRARGYKLVTLLQIAKDTPGVAN